MTAYAEVAPARDAPGRCGGTLLLYGPGDVDCLDPAVAPPHARQIVRLFSRQLLTYEAQWFESLLEQIAKIDAIDPSLFWPGARKRSRRASC